MINFIKKFLEPEVIPTVEEHCKKQLCIYGLPTEILDRLITIEKKYWLKHLCNKPIKNYDLEVLDVGEKMFFNRIVSTSLKQFIVSERDKKRNKKREEGNKEETKDWFDTENEQIKILNSIEEPWWESYGISWIDHPSQRPNK